MRSHLCGHQNIGPAPLSFFLGSLHEPSVGTCGALGFGDSMIEVEQSAQPASVLNSN